MPAGAPLVLRPTCHLRMLYATRYSCPAFSFDLRPYTTTVEKVYILAVFITSLSADWDCQNLPKKKEEKKKKLTWYQSVCCKRGQVATIALNAKSVYCGVGLSSTEFS